MLTIKIPVIPKQFSKTNHDDQFNGEKTTVCLVFSIIPKLIFGREWLILFVKVIIVILRLNLLVANINIKLFSSGRAGISILLVPDTPKGARKIWSKKLLNRIWTNQIQWQCCSNLYVKLIIDSSRWLFLIPAHVIVYHAPNK